MKLKLTLIRHGATKSNQKFRYLGATDEALSDTGRRELLKRRNEGSYLNPVKLFVSSMLRCRQTAEIIFPNISFRCIPEFTEINFGSFEGKNHYELSGNKDYQRWMESNGTLPFPGGEGRGEYIHRVMMGFDRMLLYLCSDYGKDCLKQSDFTAEIVAVVHGGTIMALLSSLFGGEYFDYKVGCGEGFECFFRYENNCAEILELKKI